MTYKKVNFGGTPTALYTTVTYTQTMTSINVT